MSMSNRATVPSGPDQVTAVDPEVGGSWVVRGSERFYRISNVDRMPPFLMSIVSDSDHWMFVSSNGGLTAGRGDADHALFPYTTEDKIQDNATNTGSRTLIWTDQQGQQCAWEPFSSTCRGRCHITRNLYKNVLGNKLLFEEINHDLGLEFRTLWTTSDRFGFVKQSELASTRPEAVSVRLLDGIQNVLPWGSTAEFQNLFSCLGDAYKQNELDPETGLGIFAFSSIPGDSAEPSEALRATVCWSTLPSTAARLLSSTQLDVFRQGGAIRQEERVCGRRGAYLVHTALTVTADEPARWRIVADVNCGGSEIARLRRDLADREALGRAVEEDVEVGTRNLVRIVASADGLQVTGDELGAAHHLSNVLFNVMRGGTFGSSYRIPSDDLRDHIRAFNREVAGRRGPFLDSLGEQVELHDLLQRVRELDDPDLLRLVHEYLPLSFSRRHGDPSRPWNRFSIEVKHPDGRRALAYEGNWRDIFQNWEALCQSFPEFIESVIFRFVNTSTGDGYNPYRISKKGYEWELPSPDEPWANIGYWGDHQLVYLLKLLEMSHDYHPGRLDGLLTEDLFVYADVPYDIEPYEDLLRDPKKSIAYNLERERRIAERESAVGADGKYAVDRSGRLWRANLAEKLLVPLLAKVSNFIPGAGFWMNTQRPEWNDANNALAGFGVSMVTLAYARRYAAFCRDLLAAGDIAEVALTAEVAAWLEAIRSALVDGRPMLASATIDDGARRQLLDRLGAAAEAYRTTIYEHGVCGRRATVAAADLVAFHDLVLEHFDRTIALNRRSDDLYHAYNIMTATTDGIAVGRLQEMLEGQVAVLSSGCLTADDCLRVLESLRASSLYRPDQHSYILYPDRILPGFLDKNIVPEDLARRSDLIARLLEDGNTDLVERDVDGRIHFNSAFHNQRDVTAALDGLAAAGLARLVDDDAELVVEIFETVFRHREFTGRSGTFYGYEGLGCIYWHMVSKLLVAVYECCLAARRADHPAGDRLVERYYDIRAGLGFNKPPEVYGAFPIDPYSHTPGYAGARQPGMTGQVKEEIITRRAELGLVARGGRIEFEPVLLRPEEFLARPAVFDYHDVAGQRRTLALEAGSLAFTVCQVPFVLSRSAVPRVVVRRTDGGRDSRPELCLDADASREIFRRTGAISRVEVHLAPGRPNGGNGA